MCRESGTSLLINQLYLTSFTHGNWYAVYLAKRMFSEYCGLVGLVATKSHACYLLGGTGWDWVRIPLGLNFSGSAGGVSGHA